MMCGWCEGGVLVCTFGVWSVECGVVWCVLCAVWSVLCGVWCGVVCAVWCVECGISSEPLGRTVESPLPCRVP